MRHAAGLYGDSATDRFKRRLAWALCNRLRQQAAEWKRVDTHVPLVPWQRIQPLASARAPEHRAAFRIALRLRAAQSELEAAARLYFDSDMEGTAEVARLYGSRLRAPAARLDR